MLPSHRQRQASAPPRSSAAWGHPLCKGPVIVVASRFSNSPCGVLPPVRPEAHAASHTSDGPTFSVANAEKAYHLGQAAGQEIDLAQLIDRNLNGPGDEARSWSLARRYVEAIKYAAEHGQFDEDLQERVDEFLEAMKNPAALAQMAAMMGAGLAIKKGVCAAGKGSFVGPLASGALTAGEVTALAIKIDSINNELNAVTFKSEIGNVSPQVAELTVDLLKDHAFLHWIKKFTCFPAGTLIATEDQDGAPSFRAIETLRPGDLVLAREEYGSKIALRPIVRTTRSLSARLAHVVHRAPNGAERDLICTPGHPVWVESRGGYVAADEIQPGETLRDGSQQVLQVLRVWVEDLPRAIEVYNFEVDQDHTYFAASPGAVDPCPILVHNTSRHEGCQPAGKTPGGAEGSPEPAQRLATRQKGGVTPSHNRREKSLGFADNAEQRVSADTGVPLNPQGAGRQTIPGSGPGGFRIPDLLFRGPQGSVRLRGSVVEVKASRGTKFGDLSKRSRDQIRDAVDYLRGLREKASLVDDAETKQLLRNARVEVFSDLPMPTRGEFARLIERGLVEWKPIPR